MNCYKYMITISIFGFIILEVTYCDQQSTHYTDMWAIYVPNTTEDHVREIATRNGYTYIGVILKDYYQIQHRKVAKRSIYRNHIFTDNLSKEPEVRWLAQQVAKKRVKRRIRIVEFNDPKWPRMWYLNRGRGLDMNVKTAWRLGYTGKGIVVTILDDGIESDHPDLRRNYDPQASYDVNSHDPDPMPRYDSNNENRHGTRCAGEVAAAADNDFCSVGVAFNASIGGVRMLDGDVTDSVEAMSLGHKPQHVHIYSASWGPDDDGKTVDGPATLARKAFHDGVTKGRRGLGSIFVWASGNGGREGDNCNCDGYTNSIYTLSISSATENGNIPWYSEACSSTLATTYSSGSGGEKQIVTTDLRRACTETHTGTSASAPLAAGLVALTLQANPMLTWRDLQHIVVMTAKPINLHAPDWVTNGVRRKVSHSFGYGLMDAGLMVQHARNWTRVPEQHICEIRSPVHSRQIPMNRKITVPLYTDGCERTVNCVKYLEHVQARITLASSNRGEIQIFLTSPMGTRSTLLARRSKDMSREGFNNWAFMTTHCWGEYAKGTWTLEIENGASTFQPARLRDWVLVLYGTDRHPQQPPVATPKPSAIENSHPYKSKKFRIQRRPPYHYYTTPLPTTTMPKRFRQFYPSKTFLSKPYAHHKFHQRHECVFQTLAKQNNVSTTQYIRMIRANLSAAQLKGWNLVAMGTEAHPLLHNINPPTDVKEAFRCSAVSLNSVCIGVWIIVTLCVHYLSHLYISDHIPVFS